jgi:hypothetical protein
VGGGFGSPAAILDADFSVSLLGKIRVPIKTLFELLSQPYLHSNLLSSILKV